MSQRAGVHTADLLSAENQPILYGTSTLRCVDFLTGRGWRRGPSASIYILSSARAASYLRLRAAAAAGDRAARVSGEQRGHGVLAGREDPAGHGLRVLHGRGAPRPQPQTSPRPAEGRPEVRPGRWAVCVESERGNMYRGYESVSSLRWTQKP
eukprot:583787-Prorocentrum_minimum.AAC.1